MFLQRLWVLLLAVCISLPLVLTTAVPAGHAAIHTYPEDDGRMMYRSRLSLRDDQDRAWQTILFKRVQNGQVKEFKLRLVGFPGQVTVAHPVDIVLHQGMGQDWTAPDETATDGQLATVVSSVGQYDMLAVMRSLDRAAPMTLELKLAGAEGAGDEGAGDEVRSLLLPPYVVKEWLVLKEMPTS